MYTQSGSLNVASADAVPVCEGSQPRNDPVSFGELAQACDAVLGECLSLADGIARFMSGQDSLPMEKMGEPGCLRDSLLRCHTEARQLREVLLLVRKMLG